MGSPFRWLLASVLLTVLSGAFAHLSDRGGHLAAWFTTASEVFGFLAFMGWCAVPAAAAFDSE
jgi:hypothetical protein